MTPQSCVSDTNEWRQLLSQFESTGLFYYMINCFENYDTQQFFIKLLISDHKVTPFEFMSNGVGKKKTKDQRDVLHLIDPYGRRYSTAKTENLRCTTQRCNGRVAIFQDNKYYLVQSHIESCDAKTKKMLILQMSNSRTNAII